MRHLITAPFRYRGRSALVVALLLLAACVFVCFHTERPQSILKLWRLYILGIGLCTSIYFFSVDHFERRDLLWSTLPVSIRQVGLGRLAVPLIVQLATTVVAALGMAVVALLVEQSPTVERLMLTLFGAQAINLVLVACIYLNEEISLILSHRRWAAIALNLGLAPVFALILVGTDLVEPYTSWNSLVFTHVLAIVGGLISLHLFTRRRNQLIGVNAWTGLPEKWSHRTG